VSAKISRGSPTRSRPKSKTVRRGGSSAAPAPGVLDSLSLPPETVRRVSGWLLFALLVAVLLAVAFALRLPQMAGLAVGEAVGGAGFTVRRIESKGLNRMNPMQVYRVAEGQLDRPMPLVDLAGTRAQLLRFGWVRDARVSRRFPDTLVVDIVERAPAAIWQHEQKLTLIDQEGVLLQPVDLRAMPELPLVIGPNANRHLGQLDQLLRGVPQLRPLIASATWVGGRRWDLKFHTGELLQLPEGAAVAGSALAKFADKDRLHNYLGRRFVRFDMRDPRQKDIIIQLPLGPGGQVPAIDTPEPGVPGGAVARTPATPVRNTATVSPDTI
jgi:cell division protein FtsQ